MFSGRLTTVEEVDKMGV